jgi:hypothetical protein
MDPSPSFSVTAYLAEFSLLLFAFALVLLNAFFVAAEFAMVKLRATRVETIADQHGWRGQILRKVHNQLDAYLSACQLGITLASLGLGWVGEPAFAHLLEPMLGALGIDSPTLVSAIAFFIVRRFTVVQQHDFQDRVAVPLWCNTCPGGPTKFSSNLIQSFMIIIINFLSSWCRHHRNIFLRCATLLFERGYIYLIKFYFPPTYFFREKLFR